MIKYIAVLKGGLTMRFRFKKRKKEPSTIGAMTQVVFDRDVGCSTQRYAEAVEALNQSNASEVVKAKFSSDFEAVMSLQRRLFAETGGNFTIEDVKQRLPDNTLLYYSVQVAASMRAKGGPLGFTEEQRQLLNAEARRLQERLKNI